MLKQRIATALLLLPLVLVVFYKMPSIDYFVLAIVVVVYLLAAEWGRVAALKGHGNSIYALAVSLINMTIWKISTNVNFWPSLSWPQSISMELPVIALMFSLLAILLSIMIVLRFSGDRQWWSASWIKLTLGLMLLPGFFVALVAIRRTEWLADFYYGGHLLLFMFCLIWAADTGAYITGKLLGKRKLAPKVSPNKSIEGAIGGIVLSMSVSAVGAHLLQLQLESWFLYMTVSLLLAILSVFGDLFESALKRDAGVKDSGTLLPGHGGVLDRLDSSLVVAPVYFVSFSLLGWF